MTPILETLLPLVTQYAHTKARLWLEGSEELAKPDDDLASFLARQDVECDQLAACHQDDIRDTYLEAVREAMERPVQSDSTTSAADLRSLLVEARENFAQLLRVMDAGIAPTTALGNARYTLSKLQSIKA